LSRARSKAPNATPAIPGNIPAADVFDPAAFDALPLPDKLDKAAHTSLAFKMALIATTASDARIRAALNAAQSVILIKARVNEAKFTHRRPTAPKSTPGDGRSLSVRA